MSAGKRAKNGISLHVFFQCDRWRQPRQSRARPACCALLAICLLFGAPPSALAQAGQRLAQSDIEAAYLYNFGKFVTWPAASLREGAPFTFCVLSDESVVPTLTSMVANETMQGHKVALRQVPSAAAAEGCHIVFIGQSADPRLARELAVLQKRAVLTVSDIPTFLDRGGMIQFIVQDKRIRFAINLKAAEQSGLTLSSQLLKLAVFVDSPHAPEGTR